MVGNEEGHYLFLWACTQLQTSGASQKGAPARTPWAKRPNITLQSFEIPHSCYNKSCFHTRAGSRPEDRPMREKLPFHSLALRLGHLIMTGVFYIQAPSQVKNIDLFSKFWLREFNQFISLSSDVNFLGQPLVVLGAEKWGQFLMRWNSKEMRLKKPIIHTSPSFNVHPYPPGWHTIVFSLKEVSALQIVGKTLDGSKKGTSMR